MVLGLGRGTLYSRVVGPDAPTPVFRPRRGLSSHLLSKTLGKSGPRLRTNVPRGDTRDDELYGKLLLRVTLPHTCKH